MKDQFIVDIGMYGCHVLTGLEAVKAFLSRYLKDCLEDGELISFSVVQRVDKEV